MKRFKTYSVKLYFNNHKSVKTNVVANNKTVAINKAERTLPTTLKNDVVMFDVVFTDLLPTK